MGNMCGGCGINDKEISSPGQAKKGACKVHGVPMSANALPPALLLQDLGRGGLEMCDLMSGAHKTPEFTRKNVFQHIPTFEDESGWTLGESIAILRYIGTTMAPELCPADPKRRAHIEWAMYGFTCVVYEKWAARVYPVMGMAAPPASAKKANDELKDALDNYCKKFIGSSKFIAGDELTIADYKLVPFLYTLAHPTILKKSGVKLSPRLEQYVKDVLSKSAACASVLTTGPYSVKEFFDGKAAEGPDCTMEVVVCGEGTCGPVPSGKANLGEKRAKVWGMPPSANTMSCAMLAMDCGVGKFEKLDLMTGEHLKPEFLAKNPFHQVPVYEGSDGFILAETGAITRYLAANYKPELYPSDPKARALVDWATDAFRTDVYPVLAIQVFYPVFGFAGPPDDQKAANEKCMDLLNKYEVAFLSSGKFVGGNKLTIAEYQAIPHLFAAMQPAVEKKTGFRLSPRMKKYVEDAMALMPSSQILSSNGGYSIKEYAASKE